MSQQVLTYFLLEYQLRATKATFLITHAVALKTATTAIAALGPSLFPADRIAIIQEPAHPLHPSSKEFKGAGKAPANKTGVVPVQELINKGLGELNVDGPKFFERKLSKGEAKDKIAFFSFSSGTTGKPKVRESHVGLCLVAKVASPLSAGTPKLGCSDLAL